MGGAILIGVGLAFYFFNGIQKKEVIDSLEELSAFQIGVFTNYDNALRVAERNNGIVVNDNSVYRVYVALLKDIEAIERVENYYEDIGLNYYIKSVLVSSNFTDDIKVYEDMIKKSNSDTYNTINVEILTKYQELL